MTPARHALMARMPPSVSQIVPQIFLGNASSSLRSEVLKTNEITAIVSLLNAPYEGWNSPDIRAIVPEERHLFIPCRDLDTMNILAVLPEVCEFIDRQLADQAVLQDPALSPVDGAPQNSLDVKEPARNRNVLIHCELGISRSPTIVIAYLMRKYKKGLHTTLAIVNEQRKVQPNQGFFNQLKVWEADRYQIWVDTEKQVASRHYQEYLDARATKSAQRQIVEK